LLGSVKSNIGHTQTAAGVAGVIKMVLAFQHGLLPATLHVDEPSPHVDWSAGEVRLLTEPVPWQRNGRPRRAGVSAFGVSGTNAHVIVEEAPAVAGSTAAPAEPVAPADPVMPETLAWVLSGRSAGALAVQAGRLAEFVAARPELDPGDVAWSLATTRTAFEHRAVIGGAGRNELMSGLAAVAAAQPAAGVVSGVAADPGRVVFVFSGHGAQWAGMGRALAANCPVFAARLAECAAALAPWVDWSLDDVLSGDGENLEREDVLQPVLWAVSVALAAVWQAAGVVPGADQAGRAGRHAVAGRAGGNGAGADRRVR